MAKSQSICRKHGCIEMTGQIFGGLTVIGKSIEKRKFRGARWICQCQCGTLTTVSRTALITGNTKSCGCLRIDYLRKVATTHGKSTVGLAEYQTWQAMKNRCRGRKNKSYARYGGRGIRVCDRWLNSFETFLADMGRRPSNKHTLERINNDGNYCPENCRWETRHKQARNTSRNRMIAHDGITLCLTDWANKLGIRFSVLRHRIFVAKWPIEKAMTVSVGSGFSRRRLKSL